MKTAFYLSTCDKCKRILRELNPQEAGFVLQDIKHKQITGDQIDKMRSLAGSYEALFSRQARKYHSLGLKDKTLEENDYRKLILEEYTFLKRPVFVTDNSIAIGSTKGELLKATEIIKS